MPSNNEIIVILLAGLLLEVWAAVCMIGWAIFIARDAIVREIRERRP